MAATACGSADPACRQLQQRMPRSTLKLPGLLSFWQSTTWLCIIKILSNPLPTSLVNHGRHASMFEDVSSDFLTAKPALNGCHTRMRDEVLKTLYCGEHSFSLSPPCRPGPHLQPWTGGKVRLGANSFLRSPSYPQPGQALSSHLT